MARDAPATLAELVGKFESRSDRPAIFTARGQRMVVLSYGQLAAEIRSVAAGLRARGVGADHMVLLWAGNSPEWVICYFAVICTGAAAIPLDNHSPPGQAAAILAHARPTLVLTMRAHVDELRAEGSGRSIDYLLLDATSSDPRSWEQLRAAPESDRAPDVRPDHLASLLYTSGTTGTPKGVPLTHGNLASNHAALLAARLVAADDRVLLPLPLHHTYPFTVGLLTTLGTGAAVILPAGISGPELSSAAAEGRATVLVAVPRLCSALWDSIAAGVRARGRWAERIFYGLLASSIAVHRRTGLRVGRLLFRAVHARLGGHLKLIGCGGAKLNPELEQRLEGLGWKVLTGYGLTETSPVLTFNRPGATKLGSEGRPVPGVELRIEKEPGQPHGEILAQGPNVFDGYWRNEEETRAAFAEDGWFRTGDLGWLDEQGYLHISGRSKEVIVLPDGKNVFPEEIEKVYAESPLFQEIAVLEHDNALVALLVPEEQEIRQRGATREAAMLREELDELAPRLAPYQRITNYRLAREPLPRTQLGKLKRHLLPELYRAAATGDRREKRAELSDDDRRLLSSEPTSAVWRWLEERFPEHDLSLDTSPQLDLQIDSLQWVTMTLEIEQRFEVSLTGEAVSRIMTLRDLLNEIERAEPAQHAARQGVAVEPPGALQRISGAVLLGLARVLMRTAFRLRVQGSEQLAADGPVVITPNHLSYLDPLAVVAALPWRRLRKTYWAGWVGVMYTGPLMRFVSRATQVFPVDPDRDLARAISTARALLAQGYSLVWFPEGRRSPDGKLGQFLPGIGVLLEDSDALVVPCAVHGTFEAWPKQQRTPKLKPIGIAFGRPRRVDALRSAGRGANDPERIARALQDEVEQLVEKG